MSDIAEYMRQGGPCIEHNQKCRVMDAASGCACANAADEIERLRAALRPLCCTCDKADSDECSRAEANCAFWNARAALEDKCTSS